MNDSRRGAGFFSFGRKNNGHFSHAEARRNELQANAFFPHRVDRNIILLPVTVSPDKSVRRAERTHWADEAATHIMDSGTVNNIGRMVIKSALPHTMAGRSGYFDKYTRALANEVRHHNIEAQTLDTLVSEQLLREREISAVGYWISNVVKLARNEMTPDFDDHTALVLLTDKMTADLARRDASDRGIAEVASVVPFSVAINH